MGCVELEGCQTLLDISRITIGVIGKSKYNTKRYIGHRGPTNEKVVHTESVTIANSETSTKVFETPFLNKTFTQNYQVDINKTSHITSGDILSMPFTANSNFSFVFHKNNHSETSNINQTFVVNALPQKITLEPGKKVNVTYRFYQYDEFNYYSQDLIISSSASKIANLDINSSGIIVFVENLLTSFLKPYPAVVNNLKYNNAYGIRIVDLPDSSLNTYILRNFPVTEKIKNYGVEIVCSEPKNI